MKSQSFMIGLTIVNALMMTVILVKPQFSEAQAQTQPGILRGTGLQIVDERGKVRAGDRDVIDPDPSHFPLPIVRPRYARMCAWVSGDDHTAAAPASLASPSARARSSVALRRWRFV